MNFEVGKEYLYIDLKTKCKIVHVSTTRSGKYLVVGELANGEEHATWVLEHQLTELPPYHDFKRGEPVMAVGYCGRSYRRYFSHVDYKGRTHCFENGRNSWSSEVMTSPWDSVRKLTEEEKAEARKDHEVLLQYFSS